MGSFEKHSFFNLAHLLYISSRTPIYTTDKCPPFADPSTRLLDTFGLGFGARRAGTHNVFCAVLGKIHVHDWLQCGACWTGAEVLSEWKRKRDKTKTPGGEDSVASGRRRRFRKAPFSASVSSAALRPHSFLCITYTSTMLSGIDVVDNMARQPNQLFCGAAILLIMNCSRSSESSWQHT